MANQKGIIKIEGTVGGMTFYKKDEQYLVKDKSSISAAKIANDFYCNLKLTTNFTKK